MTKKSPKYQQNKNTNNENISLVSEKKSSSFLPLIIAFCIPILLYIQTIGFGFTYFDDNGIIINNIAFLSNFGNVHKAFLTDAFIQKMSSFYRPLQTLSYMIDIRLSGGNYTWMYHLSNVLILGSISCLLYLLLRRFLIPPKIALLGSLIYCVHPLFVSSVSWIPAVGDLLLTFFSLLSFIFLIDFLQKKKFTFLLFHWATFTIALFCKETAAFLPIVFILYCFTFSAKKRSKKKYFLLIILYAISGIFWFWLRSKAILTVSNLDAVTGLTAIIPNLRSIPESLAKFFLPFDFAPVPGFSLFKTLAGLGIMIAIIILFIKNRERTKKEKLFCLSWYIIFMFPPMLFKSPYIDYLDHRFFLPMIGILFFVFLLFPKKWSKKGDSKRYWLMAAAVILLSSFTFIKSRDYHDPLRFYNSAVTHNPNFSRIIL